MVVCYCVKTLINNDINYDPESVNENRTISVCYFERWCPGADLNHRHEDFQSTALPLSYPGTYDERS